MGALYIVSTPIGNLEDITIRAIKTLFSADIIACEDTCRTGNLLHELKKRFLSVIPAHAGIQSINRLDPRIKSEDDKLLSLLRFDDHNEVSQTALLIDKLQQDKDVVLVSDAGTPLISDPGFNLVSECIKRKIKVLSIPGPTAVIAALSISGLRTSQFLFFGYPPEKLSHRISLFNEILRCIDTSKLFRPTIIFYCSPHKLQKTLTDIRTVFGDIPIVIGRELTKIHEEVWRGTLSEGLKRFSDPQGEFVLLLTF